MPHPNQIPTSKAVLAARAAAKKDGAGVSKRKQVMVYCIEVRIPLESISDFESESVEHLNEYGSHEIIDKTLVEAEE